MPRAHSRPRHGVQREHAQHDFQDQAGLVSAPTWSTAWARAEHTTHDKKGAEGAVGISSRHLTNKANT